MELNFYKLISRKSLCLIKKRPLDKSIIRNYKFPEQVKENNFRFGIPTTGFFNAKELIYNSSLLKEPDDAKKF